MKKKYILTFIIFLSSVAACFCQQTKLLTAEKHNEYGLVYTLPTTAFMVEITALKEQKVAGEFWKYSKIFTSNSDVITKDEINWTIESVKVTPFGVPDTENRYLMQLKAGAVTFIEVAEDGMLLSINKETDYTEPESITSTEIIGSPATGKEYLEFMNEDFISAQSSYKKSQLLAEELMEIRDAKIALTRGTAETMPTDGRQLEIMLESLEKQEKSLMSAFTGSSWKERVTKTFVCLPEEEGDLIICRFSEKEGLLTPESQKGKPVNLNIKVTTEAQLPVDAKGEEKKIPKDAVIYCIPGYAELSVAYGANRYYSGEFPMSQFGILFGLNPSMFSDKKEASYAIFDSTTGALQELGSLK